MKKIVLSVLLLGSVLSGSAQTQKKIQLPKPALDNNMTLMQSLKNRKSVREFSTEQISNQDLSNLLWAANGVNRLENNNRTAPSAMNMQDISVYVCNASGVYLYDALKNTLNPVVNKDIRADIAGKQDFMKTAPLFLLLVSDTSKFKNHGDVLSAMDAGYVSENIYLYCTAASLHTVARGTMNTEAIKKVLGLKETQVPLLNHPVGK